MHPVRMLSEARSRSSGPKTTFRVICSLEPGPIQRKSEI